MTTIAEFRTVKDPRESKWLALDPMDFVADPNAPVTVDCLDLGPVDIDTGPGITTTPGDTFVGTPLVASDPQVRDDGSIAAYFTGGLAGHRYSVSFRFATTDGSVLYRSPSLLVSGQ